MANSVERAMVVRDRTPGDRVLDVHYARLMRDPIPEMRRIHDFLELDWTPASEARIGSWIRANPQNKYGRHRYSLEDFGLSPNELDQRFKRYREYFDVERED
jgi:hypothetical protein